MPISPEHLLDQAGELTLQTVRGAPRQTDLRRAVSSAYYAVFHSLLAAVADEFVGATIAARRSPRYRLVYRSLAHERAKRVCQEVVKETPRREFQPYLPSAGFGQEVVGFCVALVMLQEARHAADYDPHHRLTLSNALRLIQTARAAIERLANAEPADKQLLLTLMLCEPRT